jgi:NUDIX domain
VHVAIGTRVGQAEVAARRELAEEIGLRTPEPLEAADEARGLWDGRRDHVRFFALRLEALPPLRLDNREIVGARLVPLDEALELPVTEPVRVYIERLNRSAPDGGRPIGGFQSRRLQGKQTRLKRPEQNEEAGRSGLRGAGRAQCPP